jgi:leader peptidase (prepilin peptidase)/N-methyltransferase
LGLIVGSFLATLVQRWPLGEGLAWGRSRCDHCGQTIAARDLLPLVSFAVLDGKCRACGARIDPAHATIEGLCGLVGGAAMLVAPGHPGLMGAMFGWLLVTLAALDLKHFWLPDRLVLLLLLVACASIATGLGPPLVDRAIGAITGFGGLALVAVAYRWLRKREGLGGGDPKLLGAIGAMLGWQALPFVLLGASSVGLLFVVVRIAAGQKVDAADRMPLGALMALAAFPAWILQQ